jgi:hypothetical protein
MFCARVVPCNNVPHNSYFVDEFQSAKEKPAMKMARVFMLILLLSTSALAADVDGRWAGTVATQNGDFPVAFTFKTDGEKLTGTTTGLDGAEVAITDGKIKGDEITFQVSFDFGGMPLVLNYKGVVSTAEIKINGDAFGMPFEFILKKAAASPAPAPAPTPPR